MLVKAARVMMRTPGGKVEEWAAEVLGLVEHTLLRGGGWSEQVYLLELSLYQHTNAFQKVRLTAKILSV
jgi:hypothetical protein